MKTCIKCKDEKDEGSFSKRTKEKDGLNPVCKVCMNVYQMCIYNKTKKNPRIKKTEEEKKERFRKWQRERKEKDPLFKFDRGIRKLIYMSLYKNNHKKTSKTKDILGCSINDFKFYIESKWEPWMNWGNYGRYNGTGEFGWDLDHIIPVSSATTKEEIIKLNHYTNFQPLCSKYNRYVKKASGSVTTIHH